MAQYIEAVFGSHSSVTLKRGAFSLPRGMPPPLASVRSSHWLSILSKVVAPVLIGCIVQCFFPWVCLVMKVRCCDLYKCTLLIVLRAGSSIVRVRTPLRVVCLGEARHDLCVLRSTGMVDPTPGMGECMGYDSNSPSDSNCIAVFSIFPRMECVYTVEVSTRMCL